MQYGFIGPGQMARAIVKGMSAAKVCGPGEIGFVGRSAEKAQAFADATGARRFDDVRALAEAVEVIVLCVKPMDARAVLVDLKGKLEGKLLVSVVAGLWLARIAEVLGKDVPLVRAMPNTPLMAQSGATALARSANCTDAQAKLAAAMFAAAGKVFHVEEKLIDAVTGLSGSGPAFVYLVIEALADGGVRAGLPRALAADLAAQTVLGAARMVQETGAHPAVLREQVASPAGTTIAGLSVLEQRAVRSAFVEAVAAAVRRAGELGTE